MDQWNGVINYGDYSIIGTVFHQGQTDIRLASWYGFGTIDKTFPTELLGKTLETNIGNIIINKLSMDGMEFKGSGPIKGPLADAINKNK